MSKGQTKNKMAGAANITVTHTPSGKTLVIPGSVASAGGGSYAIPLGRDDMGYVNQAGLLANMGQGGGGTGLEPSPFYDYIQSTAEATVTVDDSAEGRFHAQSTLRVDFNYSTVRDNAGNVGKNFSGVPMLWTHMRVKYKPGFDTAGNMDANNAQAYKLMLYGVGAGSGRLEITNHNDYDSYFGANEGMDDGGDAYGPKVINEWTDGLWRDYYCLQALTGSNQQTRVVRWWLGIDGQVPHVLSTCYGTRPDGSTHRPIAGWELGANFNETRTNTVTLWRGPWNYYDASVYANPYGLPAADLADLASVLGTNAALEAPIVIPAAPGTPVAANSTVGTMTSLSFPVTIAAAGGLPRGYNTRYSTDNGASWIAGPVIEIIAPALGQTAAKKVTGLTVSTPYLAQFQAKNPGGVSGWSNSVSGTTAATDNPPSVAKLKLYVDAGRGTDVVADGALIGSITDQSATGLVFSQVDVTKRPVLHLNYQSGLPVIELDTDKWLAAAGYNAALGGATTTAFFVMSVPTSTSTVRNIFGNCDASKNGYELYQDVRSGADAPRVRVVGYGRGALGRTAQLGVFAVDLDPSFGYRTYGNGTLADAYGANYVPNTTVPAAIGTDAANLGTLTGHNFLAAVLVYDLLTDTERASVMDYIRSKWDTP